MRGDFSSRPLKLSTEERKRLLHWYKVERTPAYMASKLGISVRTLYRYLKGEHKPRKEKVDIGAIAEQLMSVRTDVPYETRGSECTQRNHS